MRLDYYTAIILIQVFAAAIMVFVISSNPIINRKMKRNFSLEFIFLSIVSLTEWLNLYLNGAKESFRWVHYAVKVVEFSMIPLFICMGILMFDFFKYRKALIVVNVIHVVTQIICAPFGLFFYMDEANAYVRGEMYFLFVAFYTLEIIVLSVEFISAGKLYQAGNPAMVVVGVAFVLMGVCFQIHNKEIKTAFLTAEISLTMCYIYVNSLILQTDRITGLLNRWSYEKKLEDINYETCIMIFDLDSFKSINDTFGHAIGDVCLKNAAALLKEIFFKEGRVYRIGGDEFAVIMHRKKGYTRECEDRVKALTMSLQARVLEIKATDPRFTGISVGYAYSEPGFSVHWAVEQADRMMYLEKEKKHGGRVRD